MTSLDVAAKGVRLAAEELRRRGASVEPLSEGRSRNLLRVKTPNGETKIVYVKTRRTGSWHSKLDRGRPRSPKPDEDRYWLFVDLTTEPVEFYVVPEWEMENNIYAAHEAFLARHGGTRPRTPASDHHGIRAERIAHRRERWDLLGLS